MLKLHLEKGSQLERHLETAARRLQRLIEVAADIGFMRIYSYPRPSSIIALSVMLALATDAGVRPILSVSPRPPQVIDAPTVLLGYETLNYKGTDVDQPLYAIAPSIKAPPPPNAVYVDGDGSVPGMLGLIVSELGSVYARRSWTALLLAGISVGEYTEKSGKILGLDKEYFETVKNSDEILRIELISTLRAFKPLSLPACESLATTIDPYYPGITGDPDFCRDLLESEGLGELTSKPLGKLLDVEIERLAVTVLNYLTERAKIGVDIDHYIGYVPSTTRPYTIEDFRLAGLSIVASIEAFNTTSSIVSLANDLEVVYPALERWYTGLSSIIQEIIASIKPVRLKGVSWLRVFRVDIPLGIPITAIYKALVVVNKIPEESILVVPRGDCGVISPYQAEEAYGPGTAKKLIDTRIARLEGAMLCLEEKNV